MRTFSDHVASRLYCIESASVLCAFHGDRSSRGWMFYTGGLPDEGDPVQ